MAAIRRKQQASSDKQQAASDKQQATSYKLQTDGTGFRKVWMSSHYLDEIKAITYKFEDQRYPVLAIYNAKHQFHTFRQNNLSNADYLEKFLNLVEIP